MKVLTLLRHAKSDWDDPVQRDFDRPLNPRGRRAARKVGAEMRSLGLSFDRVLASPAARVAETLAEVEAAYGRLGADFDKRLYLASPDILLDIVHETPDEASTLLLVAHNPGLERLALALAAPDRLTGEVALKYPTATLAELRFEVECWTEVAAGGGTLARFIRPRDLDPSLGPDSV